jgi:outer membrane receptor protein involved in Fe transport
MPGDVIGNADLKPENANTAEIVIGTSFLKYFNLLINGYMTNIENKVEFVKIGTNVFADNVNKINSLGFENELIFVYNKLSSYLTFSYQSSTIIQDDNQIEIIFTKLYPPLMVKTGINYGIPKYFLNMNLEGQYIDSRTASYQNIFAFDPIYKEEYCLDSYFVMNFTLSTQNLKLIGSKETILKFKISNLLNTIYYYPGFKNFDIPCLNRYFTISITQNI